MPNENFYAVILAGGSGTRFWPLSRKSNPKQFLKIIGGRSLLQETLRRVQSKFKPANIVFVTSAAYRRQVERQIASFRIPKTNILLEPSGKNTAPAIGWAAAFIHAKNPNAVMAVLPSDHLITQKAAFLKTLDAAMALAKDHYLVTMGIVPTRPETGYGYLETEHVKKNGRLLYRVRRFTEKPNPPTAEKFLKTKRHFWNSGMFFWKTAVILNEFKIYLPAAWNILKKGGAPAYIRGVWEKFSSISIDYAILEKSAKVMTIPARNIGWSDLGSWESLCELLPGDKKRNILKGDTVAVDCEDTLVWGDKRVVAAVGLKNIVIVDTPDCLLVCQRGKSQKVKDIVLALKHRPQHI